MTDLIGKCDDRLGQDTIDLIFREQQNGIDLVLGA